VVRRRLEKEKERGEKQEELFIFIPVRAVAQRR
jgi:hypothetical protein